MKRVCDLAVSCVGHRLGTDGGGVLGAAALLLISLAAAGAQAPSMLNYQGRVQVGTTDFNGTGQFKFALVNAQGTTTYWSNDGTTTVGQPAAAVTLPVTQGLYSVLLGNTNLPGMAAVPPAAFTNGDVHLRVWFNDGVNGFQQFVPDQRVAAAAYAVNAGNAVTASSLTGPISVDQLPPGVVRTTNGTTTISGNVEIEGAITAAVVGQSHGLGTSGLPPGSTLEVLIDNQVAPGVRFEGLTLRELSLSRATSDLSWPGIFKGGTSGPFTNPPVSVRLSLPNGGVVAWNLAGGATYGAPYLFEFYRLIGSDGKPHDFVRLKVQSNGNSQGGVPMLTRSSLNLAATGDLPRLHLGRFHSGQPASAALRLVVDNVNYNKVVFGNLIDPDLALPCTVYLNPTHHPAISQWAFGETPARRSVQVVLASGLPGTVQLAASTDLVDGGAMVKVDGYEVLIASDGLPVERITLEDP